MNRKITFSPDEYYHIYSRGVDKRLIFMDDNDRLRFLILLLTANWEEAFHLSDLSNWQGATLTEINEKNVGESLVDIGAYCLMPNHFHILIREKENNIPKFMAKLLTSYSMYFNIKYERKGKLFESHFQAQHVDDDEYLRYLFAYIHLNPVKVTDPENWENKIIPNATIAKKFLNNYRFSSYLHYLGEAREEDVILNPSVFPDYFQTNRVFLEFINDWMEFEK